MGNALIKHEGGKYRSYPLSQTRVRTHLGDGAIVYADEDGYLGIRLDGETRIDEYLPEWCTRLDVAAPAAPVQLTSISAVAA